MGLRISDEDVEMVDGIGKVTINLPGLDQIGVTTEDLVVTASREGGASFVWRSQLWSQTLFELENLAEGLRFLAEGKLQPYIEVPSKDGLVGPRVGLRPALTFQLGHPGIGKPGRGVILYCSEIGPRRKFGPLELELIIGTESFCTQVTRADALTLASELYEQAEALSARFAEATQQ